MAQGENLPTVHNVIPGTENNASKANITMKQSTE